MYTLFLDTHNQEVVVVLYKDGEVKQAVNKVSGYQHSQIALPLIKDVMDKEGIIPKALDQIIVVIGPGSFTGVRIAVTIAKTMAYSLNIPIKTIDSLHLKAISWILSLERTVSRFLAVGDKLVDRLDRNRDNGSMGSPLIN